MRWLGGVQSEGAIAREAGYFIKAEERDELTFWALELARPKTFLGFDQLRIPAFVSRAATENSASRKLMVKLGMKHEAAPRFGLPTPWRRSQTDRLCYRRGSVAQVAELLVRTQIIIRFRKCTEREELTTAKRPSRTLRPFFAIAGKQTLAQLSS